MTLTRYDKNPFLEEMVISRGSKQVKVSAFGKDDNILMNQSTGEVHGTHVVTYKQVDEEEFVKLFTANIALTFDLKAAGIKAFNVVMWVVQHKAIERDLIMIDKYTLEEFNQCHSKTLSEATLKRGLRELEQGQIIARQTRRGWYYINPNFMFNGNRIAFTTAIEKKEGKVREGNLSATEKGQNDVSAPEGADQQGGG